MRVDHEKREPGDWAGPQAKALPPLGELLQADRVAAAIDQTGSEADQIASDADQTSAETDQASAERDQDASDNDQATADRDEAASSDLTGREATAYQTSRVERAAGSFERREGRRRREKAGRARDQRATARDGTSDFRDQTGRVRDARAAVLAPAGAGSAASLSRQLEDLRATAAVDRARAAADRQRAANDRAEFARERARLEAELHSAHLDDLTGAYRREMGELALSHEIDRARRSDGRFVVAFVDVDRLKMINDRGGHAAGDRVLQTVVDAIRVRLRSFDPIIRYGGDEFVCGLGGTDLAEAAARFESIGVAIDAEAGVGISVGLAALTKDDTVGELTERADSAMLEVKQAHHAIQGDPRR